jgi:predicted Zn-ribbon and HTH transcriptional regulator
MSEVTLLFEFCSGLAVGACLCFAVAVPPRKKWLFMAFVALLVQAHAGRFFGDRHFYNCQAVSNLGVVLSAIYLVFGGLEYQYASTTLTENLQPLTRSASREIRDSVTAPAELDQSQFLTIGTDFKTVSRCPVCSCETAAKDVLCRSCHTPHHKDCWEYAEVCSVFGCGERRYVACDQRNTTE